MVFEFIKRKKAFPARLNLCKKNIYPFCYFDISGIDKLIRCMKGYLKTVSFFHNLLY